MQRKNQKGGFSPRELIEKSGVVCVCTTDDPADTLEYHKLLAKDKSFSCRVLPAFRPEKALGIELPSFPEWLSRMEKTAGVKIDSYKTLKEVLKERIRYFDSVGCLACDHSFHIYHMKNAARMSSKRYSERVRQAKNRLNLSATATKPIF